MSKQSHVQKRIQEIRKRSSKAPPFSYESLVQARQRSEERITQFESENNLSTQEMLERTEECSFGKSPYDEWRDCVVIKRGLDSFIKASLYRQNKDVIPPLIKSLHILEQSMELSEDKIWFFNELAFHLPNEDPDVRMDGLEIEIIWNDDSRLAITLNEDDCIIVSTPRFAQFFAKDMMKVAIDFIASVHKSGNIKK